MYNCSFKKEFLRKYNKNTSDVYESYFDRLENFEEQLNKDVVDFTLEEFECAIKEMRIYYFSVLKSYVSITRKYLDFMIVSKYTSQIENVLDAIDNSIIKKWMPNDEKVWFSALDIWELPDAFLNYQDTVIPLLIFEGVHGDGLKDLCSLKKQNVDYFNEIIKFIDSKGNLREFEISTECADAIENALKETSYVKANGKMSEALNINEFVDIIETDYVIRPTNTTNDKSNKPVDKFLIYKRLARLAKERGFKNFNIKNIARSGMLKKAWDWYYKENGNYPIPDSILLIIGQQFGIKSLNTIREFVTYENASINMEEE